MEIVDKANTQDGLTILLVDDEERICENLKRSIPWADIGINQVKTAASGEEALQMFFDCPTDIVVTDIMMNGMDGLELIRHIRKRDHQVPIIILSAYDLFSYAKEAVHLNVSRYILKPIILDEMIGTLDEVVKEIRLRKKQAELEQNIQRQIQNNLAMLRERFLYEVLTMPTRFGPDFRDSLKFYNIDEGMMEGGLVISFQAFPPQNGKASTERDWQIFKFAVKNIVQEILEAAQPAYDLSFIDDRLPVLFTGNQPNQLMEKARRVATEITTHIYRFLEVEVNVGIGRWYNHPRHLQKSYNESIKVLKFSEFEGYRRIDHIDDVEKLSPSDWRDISLEHLESINQAIVQMDKEEILARWQEIEQSIQQHGRVSFDDVKIFGIGLISNIALHVHESFSTDQLLEILYELSHKKNKNELLAFVRDLLSQPEKYQKNRKRCRSPYVEQVLKYVEEHYHEDISFSQLAKDLHLSRTYLSYLFKRDTGETFIDYLIKYRIEIAKKLMRSSRHLMIREIAQMVGYPDSAYFSRLFKNVTGMSPSEYQMRF